MKQDETSNDEFKISFSIDQYNLNKCHISYAIWLLQNEIKKKRWIRFHVEMGSEHTTNKQITTHRNACIWMYMAWKERDLTVNMESVTCVCMHDRSVCTCSSAHWLWICILISEFMFFSMNGINESLMCTRFTIPIYM